MATDASGNIGIEVRPDSSGFNKRLRAQLAKELKNFDAVIEAVLDLSQKAINDVKSTVERIDPVLNVAAKISKTETKRIEESFSTLEPSVDVAASISQEQKQKVLQTIDNIDASIDAAVEVSKESLHHAQEKIENLKTDVTLNVDTDTGAARVSLAALARRRVIDLYPKVNAGALAAATTTLKALSGARVLSNFKRSITDVLKNLDTLAPRLASTATSIASLGGVGLGAAANLTHLVASLGAIAPAALALPGILSGVGVALAGSFDGLQNIHIHLREVGEELNILGKYAKEGGGFEIRPFDVVEEFKNARFDGGEAFWAEAKSSLSGVITEILQPFFSEYVGMMTSLGQFWGQFFEGMTAGVQAVGGMTALFGPLNESIQIASGGIAPFVEAIIRVGMAGGSTLPSLAEGFVNIANAFNSWSQTADISGLISSGVQALKDLWTVGANAVGILGAIAEAAGKAGGTTLESLGNALGIVNNALSGPIGQEALVTIFSGANAAISALSPAIEAIAGAFVELAPVIGQAMEKAGEAVSVLLQGLATALSDPALGVGVQEFFSGILTAAQALSPIIGELGPVFGALASTLGVMLTALAPVIGLFVEQLAPVLAEILISLQPVILALGEGLTTVLMAILPIITQVVSWIAQFMQNNPQLAATLLVVVGAVGGLITALFSIMSAISPVLQGLGALGMTWGSLAGIVGGAISFMGSAISVIFSWPVLIAAAIIALVVLIVTNWDTIKEWTINTWNAISDWTKNIWNNVVGFLSDTVQNIKDGITNGLNAAKDGVQRAWNAVANWTTNSWRNIKDSVSGAIQNVKNAVSTGFSNLVNTAINFVRSLVSGIGNNIREVPNRFMSMINSVFAVFRNIGQSMQNVGRNMMSGLINGVGSMARRLIDSVRNTVGNAISAAKRLLGIHSPSRVFMEIGQYTGEGMALGIESMQSRVQGQMAAMVEPPDASTTTFTSEVRAQITEANPANSITAALTATDKAQSNVFAFREALSGMSLALETEAGTVMARLNNMGERRLARAR